MSTDRLDVILATHERATLRAADAEHRYLQNRRNGMTVTDAYDTALATASSEPTLFDDETTQ